MFGIDDMAMATGLSALANIGGGMISSGGQASANATNVQMQNQYNQQMLNAQQAQHQQNTGFMEDSQAFSAQQQSEAQSFNANEAEKNRAFQKSQAEWSANTQMQFQERMANSAYERAMADMRRAGLNPILAYQRGGAAVPGGSGAMASGATATSSGLSAGMSSAAGPPSLRAPTVQNERESIGRAVGNLSSSALDTFKTLSGINLIKEQEQTQRDTQKNLNADTSRKEAETLKTGVDTDKSRAETSNIITQNRILAAQGYTQEEIGKMSALERANLERYGAREAPATMERMLRTIQGAIESGTLNTQTLHNIAKPYLNNPKAADMETPKDDSGKYTFTPGRGWHLKGQ